MTTTMRYNLATFGEIVSNGFDFEQDPLVLAIINTLAKQVGAPDYVKTPVFQKKEKKKVDDLSWKRQPQQQPQTPFVATKMETKTGVDAQIDSMRSLLNKLTDKNYLDMRAKIFDLIDAVKADGGDMTRVSAMIFEIASTNRFFSKMYAELFADLLGRYEDDMKSHFVASFDTFSGLFDAIEYVNPDVDYDRFCKINKDNEKRRSLSAFFVNLFNNKVIQKDELVGVTCRLLFQLLVCIDTENKKNEVDELTENIALLYVKGLYDETCVVNDKTVLEHVKALASTNVKDTKSFTNKSKFRFMDL
jgi:hypothetical protein